VSRFTGTALIFALIAAAVPLRAQSQAATPHTPEMVGIYTGMPVNAARIMLQKHSSSYQVQNNALPETGFSLSDPQKGDVVCVYLTKAPNEPAVWLVTKGQTILRQNQMSITALLTALREKYGKETLTEDHGGGGLYLIWLFDQNGRLLASADPALAGCGTGITVGYMMNFMSSGQLPVPSEDVKRCYASFFAVTASLNRSSNELLQAYSVQLVNLPYAFRALSLTVNARNAAAEKARQAELKKANKNKPDF
jgi:hypothetical protein